MNANVSQVSARIYKFPLGGRQAASVLRDDAGFAADPKFPRLSADHGAWYHEAAIQESKRSGER
jgi:Protein of unknown function (DUF2735)